jgi:predicted nucleic acid-binding protein
MNGERLFLDTAFIQALVNRHDQYHPIALRYFPRMRRAGEVWVTEAVLLEVGNALSAIDRSAAELFIRICYSTANMRVVPTDTDLFMRGLELYGDRPDKNWSLTDCISFVVMQENGLTDAMTTDTHYRQAGYRALLLENE